MAPPGERFLLARLTRQRMGALISLGRRCVKPRNDLRAATESSHTMQTSRSCDVRARTNQYQCRLKRGVVRRAMSKGGSSRGRRYFHVTSMPKKCRNTSRSGRFFGFICGLRM